MERDLKKLHVCLLIQDVHLVIGRAPFDVEAASSSRAEGDFKEIFSPVTTSCELTENLDCPDRAAER